MTAERNGLRMKNEKTMKEKRFSFLPTRKKIETKSRHTFGTLPFARHTSQRFAKVKEPNLPACDLYINNYEYLKYKALDYNSYRELIKAFYV